MPSVCLYFQVHQPYRLGDLRIGENTRAQYFDAANNRAIFRKVAEKCYLPANALLLRLLQHHPEFRVAFSLSGVFIDQCREYGEDVLDSFLDLHASGQVEFLGETYYHSLASLASLKEFTAQVALHAKTIYDIFGTVPSVFRNTELIYSNEIAEMARFMGFRGILAEGLDHILLGRSPNEVYMPTRHRLTQSQQATIRKERPHPRPSRTIHMLLKNYRLSDDVAFRFSDKSWIGFPLTAERFTDWLMGSGGSTSNLFMDYETFGEHQWADTGIFSFLAKLPALWEKHGIVARTPSETIDAWKGHQKNAEYFDAPDCVSWADTERDLSAWQGNEIQVAALQALHALETPVKKTHDPHLLQTWRRLQTSDHFYYMSTKHWNDGDVHKYFSPYESPYEAYRRFSHALCDLRESLKRMKNYELGITNNKSAENPYLDHS